MNLSDLRKSGKDELYNTRQVSEMIQVSAVTLAKWRQKGIGLPFCRVGKNVRYRAGDVIDFLDHSRVEVEK